MSERIVSVERVIDAPPERIFAVLADARRHHEIDGSGTVRSAVDAPDRLSQGATFGMDMQMGMKYRMVNRVIEFEEGRRIAWAPKPEVRGKVKENLAGRIWRYELEPVDGGTRVTETWDATAEKGFLFHRLLRVPSRTRKGITESLARLDRVVTGTA